MNERKPEINQGTIWRIISRVTQDAAPRMSDKKREKVERADKMTVVRYFEEIARRPLTNRKKLTSEPE